MEEKSIAQGLCSLILVFAALLLAAPASLADGEWNAGNNVYLAAGVARTPGPVSGDFYALGGQVTVEHPVKGEVYAAGGRVQIAAPVGSDLQVLGGDASVANNVAGDARIAAGTISVAKGARVGGKASLAGGNVEIAGTLERGARILTDRLVVSGRVGGPLRIIANRIEIAPGAKIEGPIDYTSRRELVIPPGAEVEGPITRMPSRAPENNAEVRRTGRWAVPFFYTGVWAAGILMLLVFPQLTIAAQDRVRTAPWQSLALGAALFFTVPMVALVLTITVVGIPVALAILALYGLLLLAGFLTAAFFLAERAGRVVRGRREPGTGWRIGLLLVALMLLAALPWVPFAGAVLLFMALLFGIGALALEIGRHYRTGRPAAA
jgi:cytoskeletal protein CcmA (bactofilin family)